MWNVETGETVLGPLKGHTGAVFCVAFSLDDRRIVSGSLDCSVRIWDVQTGKQLLESEEHKTPVCSVAFSSDSSRVAFSDDDFHILIWDVDSKRRIRLLNRPGHFTFDLHFSADDRFIAAIGNNSLSIWDLDSGEWVPTSRQARSFGDLVWFGENTLCIRIGGEIRRWFDRERIILDGNLALSPDRKWIAAGIESFNIYLYSRDPSPEELASMDDIEDDFLRL